jgi:hypothetical protein
LKPQYLKEIVGQAEVYAEKAQLKEALHLAQEAWTLAQSAYEEAMHTPCAS